MMLARVLAATIALAPIAVVTAVPAAAQYYGGGGGGYGGYGGDDDYPPPQRRYRQPAPDYPPPQGYPPPYRPPPQGYRPPPPPPGPGYGRPGGSVCVTSRGSCPTGMVFPRGAPCACEIPGFGKKRGAIGY